MKHTINRSNKRSRSNKRKVTYHRKNKRTQKLKRKHILRRRGQKGGEGSFGNGSLANPPPFGSNVTAAFEKQQLAQQEQNRANGMVGGGVSCCNNNDDYSYPCPAGKCGPIPQTENETTNGLIKQAAVITATGNANAEYDADVSTKYIT